MGDIKPKMYVGIHTSQIHWKYDIDMNNDLEIKGGHLTALNFSFKLLSTCQMKKKALKLLQ